MLAGIAARDLGSLCQNGNGPLGNSGMSSGSASDLNSLASSITGRSAKPIWNHAFFFQGRRLLLPVRRIIGIHRAVLTSQRLASAPVFRRPLSLPYPCAGPVLRPRLHQPLALLQGIAALVCPLYLVAFGVRPRSLGEPIGERRGLIDLVAERRLEAVRNHLPPALLGIDP